MRAPNIAKVMFSVWTRTAPGRLHFYVALDEGDVRLAVQDVFRSDDTKCAVIGRQLRLGDAADKRLLLDTIANKISDRNDL